MIYAVGKSSDSELPEAVIMACVLYKRCLLFVPALPT